MESRRVPPRNVTPSPVVPMRPEGSTRPTSVSLSSTEAGRGGPLDIVPPLPRGVSEPTSVAVSQRQAAEPLVVEAPKYREVSNPVQTDKPIRSGSQLAQPANLSQMTGEYPKIPARVPRGILFERNVR